VSHAGPDAVSGSGVDETTGEAATATTEDLVRLAALVGRRLTDVGATVSTAESCTGGLIGHVLTEISGSSAWYLGGVVVYSDELKRQLVDVPAALIVTHGAVSPEVAQAMADGAQRSFGTTFAISVTGIAGPTGGTATKPVGLVYVAVAGGGGCTIARHLWSGDRSANKRESAHAALRLLLDRLSA
jgi:PncC family amidohydrolase